MASPNIVHLLQYLFSRFVLICTNVPTEIDFFHSEFLSPFVLHFAFFDCSPSIRLSISEFVQAVCLSVCLSLSVSLSLPCSTLIRNLLLYKVPYTAVTIFKKVIHFAQNFH